MFYVIWRFWTQAETAEDLNIYIETASQMLADAFLANSAYGSLISFNVVSVVSSKNNKQSKLKTQYGEW